MGEWLQEAGEEIMGMSASDLKALEDDAKAYDAALQHANLRPLTFNLKVAEDTYNDETRIKKSVNRQACQKCVPHHRCCRDYISFCLLTQRHSCSLLVSCRVVRTCKSNCRP